MRTRYFFHSVGEAFPRENRMARVVWSLVAIYSDLVFEIPEIGREEAPRERADAAMLLRRVYFFRGSLRSLYSAKTQLDRLTAPSVGREFEELARSVGTWDAFCESRRTVKGASKHFNRYRNCFGAHSEEAFEASLGTAREATVVAQSLTSDGRLGVEFAAEVFSAVLEEHLGSEESGALKAELERLHTVTMECVRCIQLVIKTYASRYPLLRKQS